jgi:hypothetical protein
VFILQCQKVRKLVRFKQKGQKQASFLVFHQCCHGCLLRGPRYISSVPARISKGQGAGPEKGLFSVLLDFQKRHFLGTLQNQIKYTMKY